MLHLWHLCGVQAWWGQSLCLCGSSQNTLLPAARVVPGTKSRFVNMCGRGRYIDEGKWVDEWMNRWMNEWVGASWQILKCWSWKDFYISLWLYGRIKRWSLPARWITAVNKGSSSPGGPEFVRFKWTGRTTYKGGFTINFEFLATLWAIIRTFQVTQTCDPQHTAALGLCWAAFSGCPLYSEAARAVSSSLAKLLTWKICHQSSFISCKWKTSFEKLLT